MSREKYTASQVAEALTRASGIIAAAARALSCDRDTVYRYIKKYPTVQAALDQANEVTMDEAEGRLIALLRDPKHKDHFAALRFYLRTKARRRGYIETQEIEGGSGGPVRIELVPVRSRDDDEG